MKPTTLFLSAAVLTAAAVGAAEACSVVIWSDNGQAVVVGRNMDWVDPMPVDLWALPRGIARDGRAGKTSIRWVSRYGSVVASDNATSDGINEKGFYAGGFWIHPPPPVKYPSPDARPAINDWQVTQYLLDNFQNVKEAVGNLEQVRVAGFSEGDFNVDLHWFIADASGERRIFANQRDSTRSAWSKGSCRPS